MTSSSSIGDEKLKIVNLCFADDLMIFCKGESKSVEMVMKGLSEFSKLSGLKPSPGKIHIFFSGWKKWLRGISLGLLVSKLVPSL